MTEAERAKKLREALFVMIGCEIAAFFVFWLVQAFLHNPNLAFALLLIGACLGAGYYVYQSYKLRPKDKT